MRGEYIASVAAICYALSSWRLLVVVGCGCLEVVDKGCEAIFGGEDAIFPSSSSYGTCSYNQFSTLNTQQPTTY
jgi:hypothetical protein